MKKAVAIIPILLLTLTGFPQILKTQVPDKIVVLTFDDATASQYTVVAPLLKAYGFGATFFVCEFPTKLPDRSAYMSWEQIKALNEMGFQIGNHTRTHLNVNKASRERLLEELNYIENKCDSLTIERPTSFAYPGYNLGPEVLSVLQEKGYRVARAGGSRPYDPLNDHPLLVPSWATNADNKEQIFKALNEAKDGKIVVLTIHGVPDVEHPWVNTPPELFREYLQYLSDNHYQVIALRDLAHSIAFDKAAETITPDFNKKLKN